VLLEATYALMFLTGLSLALMKLSLNVTAPRQWTLQNTVTDAHLTYEKALAQRMPLPDLLANTSPWPTYPAKSESTVTMGKLPGGQAITGKVIRTKIPDANNFPVDGGSGTTTTNPAGIRTWRFQSILTYDISGRTYMKSQTVVRSQ